MKEVLKCIDQRLSEYDAAQKKAMQDLSRLPQEIPLRVGLAAGGEQVSRYASSARRDMARQQAQRDYAVQVTACIGRWRPKLQIARKLLLQTSRICDIPAVTGMADGRQTLIRTYMLSDAEYERWWLSQPYVRKPVKHDTVLHGTSRGEQVRTKSEKIIADWLYSRRIPYRYEAQLMIPGFGLCYPGFTILNRHSRQLVYLDHFGMLGDEEYAHGAVIRFNAFIRAGYQLGVNYFCTMESEKNPLDSRMLSNLLEPVAGR